LGLSDCGCIGVIFQMNRDAKCFAQWSDQVHAIPAGQGEGIVEGAAQRIHRAGAAYANSR
jgi:hypothetical protein